MTRPQPNVVGAHQKRIAAAARKLARRQALVAEAETERDALIREALAVGLTRGQIAKVAGISPDRVKQIRFQPETAF